MNIPTAAPRVKGVAAASANNEPFLQVERCTVRYGATTILEDLALTVGRGEFVALLGSSGCGKTTLLRTIAGFIAPASGRIMVASRDVTRLPPDRRGMALVFQSYALWPHMTVAQNIGYGLKLKGRTRAQIATRVGEIQDLLGLQGLGDRKPAALSGGQRQRVALGRALAVNPDILLLDEPLSNLDARTRLVVRHEIGALQQRLGITAIHVTHDREEAMVMADRIVILDAGRIAQVGTPEEVYNRPSSAFVAAFMGAENRLPLAIHRSAGQIRVAPGASNHEAVLAPGARNIRGPAVEARFRAEACELHGAEAVPPDQVTEDAIVLSGTVAQVSYPGGLWRHVIDVGEQMVVVDSSHPFARGEAVSVRVPGATLFLYDLPAAGEAALGTPP